jgi:BlaI family penicillinase repressor
MRQPKLTKAEREIMEVLWSRGASSAREIQHAFPAQKRPAFTTVQTVVYRLEAKRAVRIAKKIGNTNIFVPLVSRTVTGNSFIDDLLHSFGGVIACLIESGKLTMDDLKEAEQTLRSLSRKDKRK